MKAYAQKQSQPPEKESPQRRRLASSTIGNRVVPALSRASVEGREAAASTPLPTRFAYDFSRFPAHSKTPAGLQAKSTANAPADLYEEEADRIAGQVVGMAEPHRRESSRQDRRDAHDAPQGPPAPTHGRADAAIPAVAREALRSAAQPLDATTLKFMQSRFGHDFSRVRVHTDAKAAESAKALGAHAYTVGEDIAFGTGQYRPHQSEGRRLLAHELAHTLQQRSGIRTDEKAVSPAGNGWPRGQKVSAEGGFDPRVRVTSHALPPTVQRQPAPDGTPATPTPTYTLPALLQIFSRRRQDRFIKDVESGVFEREYDDQNAVRQTASGVQLDGEGPSWTVTFVVNGNCIFIKAAQDGTEIVNYYQRCENATVTLLAPWFVLTTNGIFAGATAKFDFGSPAFSAFYTNLDVEFEKNAPHINPSLIIITMDGQNDAVNSARANAIKDDLAKRGMNPNRISIQFVGNAGSNLILIQGNLDV